MKTYLSVLKMFILFFLGAFFIFNVQYLSAGNVSGNDLDETSLPENVELSLVNEADSLVLVELFNSTDGPNWKNNNNWLTGPIKEWFGITVVADKVTEIKLEKNNLNGNVPAVLGQLTSLNTLELDTNNLSGAIPVELGQLINLEFLLLSGNQLTGTIPVELGLLKNIRQIYLSDNQLTGKIPVELGNLGTLKWLTLSGNKLEGNIPVELSKLSNLEYLNLSRNELVDPIPTELGSLASLRWLNLGYNNFSGEINKELTNLSPVKLELLYLDGNQLSGAIPAEIGKLKALKWLNLSHNQLSGNIPDSLMQLKNLSLLFLNDNLLEGEIPAELSQIKSLEWLNLGQNQLHGNIPTEFWSLTHLKLLYLYSNQLSGAISENINSLSGLMYIDLSSNMFDVLPEITALANLRDLTVSDNLLDFGHLEYNMDSVPPKNFVYAPQGRIGEQRTAWAAEGETYQDSVDVGGTRNIYQWFKNGEILPEQTFKILSIENFSARDEGLYHVEVTNDVVPGLKLTSQEITVQVAKCQKIVCNVGWNIVSIPVVASDTDISKVFKPFIINKSLVRIEDELGNTLEYSEESGLWKNNIGNIQPGKGYKVKMIAKDSLTICGLAVNYPYQIVVKAGWNIIGYPHSEAYNGMEDIVKQLIENGTLVKVQDEIGNTIEDLGVYGGWKNTIGDFVPGKGYKINVSSDDTLTIYESYTRSNSITQKYIKSEYFNPAYLGNGINHMNIYLVNPSESGIMTGDEIGIFDGDVCVGGAKITESNVSAINIIASDDDETSNDRDGFEPGNEIELRLVRNGKEYPLQVVSIGNANSQFEKDGTLLAKSVTFVSNNPLTENPDFGFMCYPNPFKEILNIELNLKNRMTVTIEIYDLLSRRIVQLYDGNAEGTLKVQWDATDSGGNKLMPGIYMIRVNDTMRKVILN